MTGSLADRVAIVTGGGWNIGRATALACARAGAKVVVASRNRENLLETVELISSEGHEASAVQTDVTELEQVERLVATTRERYGPVDVLAALAGGPGEDVPIDEADPERWEYVFRRNVFSTFYCVRAVLPGMRERDSGTILTCTGGGGFFPRMDVPSTAYSTSKAALCRLTDQLGAELLGTKIRVNCLQPGLIWSPDALAEVEAEEARTGVRDPRRDENRPPEDAAELALWLLSPDSAPLTGRIVAVHDDWWRDPAKVRQVVESYHLYCLRRHELH